MDPRAVSVVVRGLARLAASGHLRGQVERGDPLLPAAVGSDGRQGRHRVGRRGQVDGLGEGRRGGLGGLGQHAGGDLDGGRGGGVDLAGEHAAGDAGDVVGEDVGDQRGVVEGGRVVAVDGGERAAGDVSSEARAAEREAGAVTSTGTKPTEPLPSNDAADAGQRVDRELGLVRDLEEGTVGDPDGVAVGREEQAEARVEGRRADVHATSSARPASSTPRRWASGRNRSATTIGSVVAAGSFSRDRSKAQAAAVRVVAPPRRPRRRRARPAGSRAPGRCGPAAGR